LLKAIFSMTDSLKPKRRKTHIMTTSPAYYPRSATKCVTVLTPFLRRLNTGTLAIFLFVALASLTSIRGREVETKGLIPVKADNNEIAIAHFSFSPRVLTLSPGATVTWINHDKVPHVISSADNHFQTSALLDPGQSFSNTFAAGGTYSYFCSIHPPDGRTNHRQVNVQPYHT
jgi:plastocyanin